MVIIVTSARQGLLLWLQLDKGYYCDFSSTRVIIVTPARQGLLLWLQRDKGYYCDFSTTRVIIVEPNQDPLTQITNPVIVMVMPLPWLLTRVTPLP